MSDKIQSELDRRRIGLDEDRIPGHVGRGSDLLVCDRRHAIVDPGGVPIPGLWACRDIVSG